MAAAAFGLWRTRAGWWRSRGALLPATRGRLLLLAAGAVGWLWWVGIAVLTQAGFSGNDRYLVLGSALISIAGGVGWGWGAATAVQLAARGSSAAIRRHLTVVTTAAVAVALGDPDRERRRGSARASSTSRPPTARSSTRRSCAPT